MRNIHVNSARTAWPRAQRHALRWAYAKAKLAAAPILANVLYASFATAQNTLHHIDPIVFAALQMTLLLPVSFLFLYRSRAMFSLRLVQQGIGAGLLLGMGFLGVALSLRNIGIIRAAALTGCDGILASLIARFLLHQRQSGATGFACIFAGIGVFLLWLISPGAWLSDTLALIVGLLFCLYALYVERTGLLRTGREWAFFGVLFATMAATALIIAIGFGSWTSLRTLTPADLSVLWYSSWCTLLLPLLINTLLQRKLSAVTLCFLALLEPLASIGFAWLQGAMQIALLGWFGVVSILLGILFQTHTSSHCTEERSEKVFTRRKCNV